MWNDDGFVVFWRFQYSTTATIAVVTTNNLALCMRVCVRLDFSSFVKHTCD